MFFLFFILGVSQEAQIFWRNVIIGRDDDEL